MTDWTRYVHLLYILTVDADVFGRDPLGALEVVGMALERTHSRMTKDDEFFTQNVLGYYAEQLAFTRIAA